MPVLPSPAPCPEGELSSACPEDPRPDEVHVLALGLDGLAAAVVVRLLRCGVLGLNVNDPRPVTSDDLAAGAYRPSDVGRAREAALRRRLRELDPRCAPVSAPELFPGALLPGTVVVHSVEHPAPEPRGRPGAGEHELTPGPDPRHPVVSLHRTGGRLVRWPTVPWAHRPCADCVAATLDGLRAAAEPRGADAVLAAWAGPAHAEAVAAGLAVEVLAVALDELWTGSGRRGDGSPCGNEGPAQLFAPPWPGEVRWLALDRSRCLCGLGQE